MRERSGSDLIVDLLHEYEIPFAALNPGSASRGLRDSIVTYGGSLPEVIECPYEGTAVQIAHGYARAAGRPMAAIVNGATGLLHATAGVYHAYLDRVPVIVMGGTGPREPVRDYVKWDHRSRGAEDAVESFARGYRAAVSDPPGPVYLAYDASFQEGRLAQDPPLVSSGRVRVSRLAPEPQAIERLAGWLVRAREPVLVAGLTGRRSDAVNALVELAELLGAAVLDRGERLCFPSRHPLNLTGAEGVLSGADLIVLLDVEDAFEAVPAPPPDSRLAEVGFGDLGLRGRLPGGHRLLPVDLSVLADTALALPALYDACRRLASDEQRERFARRARAHAEVHAALRTGWADEADATAEDVPVAPAYLAAELWEVIRATDWVLAGDTLRQWALRLWDVDCPIRHPGRGSESNSEIGISLGVALAHLGSGRLVVDIQERRGLALGLGPLWVASHHRIPMLTVLLADRPSPDFAAVARGLGWYAEGPVERPGDLRVALTRARDTVLREGGPALVDIVCGLT